MRYTNFILFKKIKIRENLKIKNSFQIEIESEKDAQKNFIFFFFLKHAQSFYLNFLPERFKWLAKTRHLHWLIFFMRENFQSIHLFKYKAKSSLERLPDEAPPCGEMNMLRRNRGKGWEPFASAWDERFSWTFPFMACLLKPLFWGERGTCWNAGRARIESHFKELFRAFFFYIRKDFLKTPLIKY